MCYRTFYFFKKIKISSLSPNLVYISILIFVLLLFCTTEKLLFFSLGLYIFHVLKNIFLTQSEKYNVNSRIIVFFFKVLFKIVKNIFLT
jgi:hypothetical protein